MVVNTKYQTCELLAADGTVLLLRPADDATLVKLCTARIRRSSYASNERRHFDMNCEVRLLRPHRAWCLQSRLAAGAGYRQNL